MNPIAGLIYRQQRRGALDLGQRLRALRVGLRRTGSRRATRSCRRPAHVCAHARQQRRYPRALRSGDPHRNRERVHRVALRHPVRASSVRCGVCCLRPRSCAGDEEEGRADLLYAGPVTRASGIGALVQGLGVVWAVLFVTVASWIVTIGLVRSLLLVDGGPVVLARGVRVRRDVPRHRRRRIAAHVDAARAHRLSAGPCSAWLLLVRAIAESVDGARLAAWASPVSWLDKTRPLDRNQRRADRARPVVVAIGRHSAGDVARVATRPRHRLLPSRDTAEPHTALLSSPTGLTFRLTRGTTTAWACRSRARRRRVRHRQQQHQRRSRRQQVGQRHLRSHGRTTLGPRLRRHHVRNALGRSSR